MDSIFLNQWKSDTGELEKYMIIKKSIELIDTSINKLFDAHNYISLLSNVILRDVVSIICRYCEYERVDHRLGYGYSLFGTRINSWIIFQIPMSSKKVMIIQMASK